jgi:two-component system, OmpR family, response regulator RegX3
MHIAVLEDEQSLAIDLANLLKKNGHEVSIFADGQHLVETLQAELYDMFILDWKVPSMNGFEVLKHIRSELGFKTPIIFLTSNDNEADIVNALSSGADDYSVKPLRPQELMARVNALVRRSYGLTKKNHSPETVLGYTFYNAERTVEFAGSKVSLTDKEFMLANYFFSNLDRPLSRTHIMMRIWGQSEEGLSRTLDVHVAWIRNKLNIGAQAAQVRLVAIHGYGYRLMQVPSEV